MNFFTQHIFNTSCNKKTIQKPVKKKSLKQHKKCFQTGSPAVKEKVEILENSETSRELEKVETKTISKNISYPFAAERNFIKFPFFDLSKSGKRNVLEIKDTIYQGDEKLEVSWKVSRDVDSAHP